MHHGDVVGRAEDVAYSKNGLAVQLVEQLRLRPDEDVASYEQRILENFESNPQIHPEAITVLQGFIEREEEIDAKELEYFLYGLLALPGPTDQERYVRNNAELLESGKVEKVRDGVGLISGRVDLFDPEERINQVGTTDAKVDFKASLQMLLLLPEKDIVEVEDNIVRLFEKLPVRPGAHKNIFHKDAKDIVEMYLKFPPSIQERVSGIMEKRLRAFRVYNFWDVVLEYHGLAGPGECSDEEKADWQQVVERGAQSDKTSPDGRRAYAEICVKAEQRTGESYASKIEETLILLRDDGKKDEILGIACAMDESQRSIHDDLFIEVAQSITADEWIDFASFISFAVSCTPEQRAMFSQNILNVFEGYKKMNPVSDVARFEEALVPAEREFFAPAIERMNEQHVERRSFRVPFEGRIEKIKDYLSSEDPWGVISVVGPLSMEERYELKEEITALLEKEFARISSEESRANLGNLFFLYSSLPEEERRRHSEKFKNVLQLLHPAKSHEEFQKRAVSHHSRIKLLKYVGALTPAERELYTDELRPLIKIGTEEEIGQLAQDVLMYFAMVTPEERAAHKSDIETLLTKVRPEGIVAYYSQLPEDERLEIASYKYYDRIKKGLVSEVGDLGARDAHMGTVAHMVRDGEIPLSLVDSAAKKGRLAVVAGFASLGCDVLPVLSWKLTKVQKVEMLSALHRVAEKQSEREPILEGVVLPYRERGEDPFFPFEEEVVGWLQAVTHLTEVEDGKYKDFLQAHVTALREIQQEVGVAIAGAKPTAPIKARIREQVAELKVKSYEFLYEQFRLAELGVESGEFVKFVEAWNNEIDSVAIFLRRLQQQDDSAEYAGSELLVRTIIADISKERWHEARYDTGNEIVADQLSTLNLLVDAEEGGDASAEAVLDAYKEGAYVFSERPEKGVSEVKQVDKVRFVLEDDVRTRLVRNVFGHGHVEGIFDSETFRSLTEAQYNAVRAYMFESLLGETERSEQEANIVEGRGVYATLDVDAKKVIKVVRDCMKTLGKVNKSPDSISRTIQGTLTRLPEEIRSVAFFKEDLAVWLSAVIEAQKEESDVVEDKRKKRKLLFTHTTDHPKTLFEIGKFPANSGSCQSYEYSDFETCSTLPGFVADAHIQAIVTREVELPVEMSDVDMEQLTVTDMDEGRNIMVLGHDNQSYEVPLPKPISRCVVYLGEYYKYREPRAALLIPAPSYEEPGAITNALATELQDSVVERWSGKLQEAGLRMHTEKRESREDTDENIYIERSRNPRGHYNDITDGVVGGSEDYQLVHGGEVYDWY